jgi:uncharacterized membrane protein
VQGVRDAELRDSDWSEPTDGDEWPQGRAIASHARRGRGRGGGASRHSHGHGHAHGHGEGTELSASVRTVRIMQYVLIPLAILTAIAVVVMWPDRPAASSQGSTSMQRAYGQVLSLDVESCPPGQVTYGEPLPCGSAVVGVGEGPGAGTQVMVDLPQGPGAPRLTAGDEVVLSYLPSLTDNGPGQWGVMDKQRGRDLTLMLLLCAVVIVAFGRWRGLTAIIGLGVSFGFLLLFIVPAILDGAAPLPVAIVGSAAIMFVVLFLTHGINVHTSVAVLGTLASLLLTGLLGALFTATTSMTGFASEEALYLSILNTQVDMRGLLLAGIIIGALGVLDDVTVTQATAVAELARTATSRLELFRSAIRVGRAHVASAVNTIVLAYAGASLPLLLLIVAGGQDVSDLLTGEPFAQEIVRAAVGTIGLVAAVPITTGLAALVAEIRGGATTTAGPAAAKV